MKPRVMSLVIFTACVGYICGLYSNEIFEVEDSPIMTMYNKEIEKQFLVA